MVYISECIHISYLGCLLLSFVGYLYDQAELINKDKYPALHGGSFISCLVTGALLFSLQGLTKVGDTYKNKIAHIEVAKRMRKAYEKSEDRIYVLENNIPIDP